MPRPSTKTPAKIQRMIERHAEGASSREIAKEFGVAHGSILMWLRDLGLSPHPPNGPAGARRRPAADAPAVAAAGALATLEAVATGVPPADRDGALAHLQARIKQISSLADQLARGVPGGEANPAALATIVRLERELAAGIVDLTPAERPAPEDDPANLSAAAEVRQKLATLIDASERAARCAHCGRNPFMLDAAEGER